jgi:hypothetical protein
MGAIVDQCQALIDEHFDTAGKQPEDLMALLPNRIIGRRGEAIKEDGSVLPEEIVERIYDLSYEFMDYPENIAELGLRFYGTFLESDGSNH